MSEGKKHTFSQWLREDLLPIFMLCFEASLIISLFYLSDFLYHLTNSKFQNPSLFDWNLSFFAFVAALLLIENRLIRNLSVGFISISTLFAYFHFQYFGISIQPSSFLLISGNLNEISLSFGDSIGAMLAPFLIVIGILILILPILNADRFKIDALRPTRSNLIAAVLILGLTFVGFYVTHLQFKATTGKLALGHAARLLPKSGLHSIENLYRSFSYLCVGILPRKFSEEKNSFPPLPPPAKKVEAPDVNVILIIGESLRAKSLTLLGYEKNNTTPELNAISKDLLYAASIYGGGTITRTSLPSLINRTPFPAMTEQMFLQENCLFNLAQQNGFQTHFYSAQLKTDIGILRNYLCQRYIDHYESRTSYTSKHPAAKKYDALLVQMVGEVDFESGPQFVVLHQRGSHAPYKFAYPETYQRFESEYDNSVAYTSFILDSLFNAIKSRTKRKTYIIFTSDHGELLGEHGMQGHGWFYPEVYRVPFLFYVINDKLTNFPLSNIRSHYGISNLVAQLLGFDLSIEKRNEVYVNGPEVNGLGGYLKIVLDKDGALLSKEKFR